jgi:hypothetical protein
MPYAVASMPQTCVSWIQHERCVENENMHFGASGGTGVQLPETMKPHVLVAALEQHASGGVFDSAGFAGGAVQVAVPHISEPAAAPALPPVVPPLAAGLPLVPADAVVAPLPDFGAVLPLPAAAGDSGKGSLLHATPRPAIANAIHKARVILKISRFSRTGLSGTTPSTTASARQEVILPVGCHTSTATDRLWP